MIKPTEVKRPALFSRIAYLALIMLSVTAAILQVGILPAQAGRASLSWSAPTTNTNGSPLTTWPATSSISGTLPEAISNTST